MTIENVLMIYDPFFKNNDSENYLPQETNMEANNKLNWKKVLK